MYEGQRSVGQIQFAALEDVVVCDLDGGSALLDLNSSKYFRLNATGTFVWDMIQKSAATPEEIAEKMTSEYEVSTEACLPDIRAILDALSSANLVSKIAV